MRTRGNGSHNRDVRIVNWPHFHGVGVGRFEHQHIFDVRDEQHIRGYHEAETEAVEAQQRDSG